eukprot:scaffold275_cov221-Alexandrium_tamarense.AAC.13
MIDSPYAHTTNKATHRTIDSKTMRGQATIHCMDHGYTLQDFVTFSSKHAFQQSHPPLGRLRFFD